MADFKLTIGGMTINPDTFRANRTIDSMSDVFTASVAWTPGLDPKLDSVLKLYGYPSFTLELAGELIQKGFVTDVANAINVSGGRTKKIVGYSSTIILVDSQLPLSLKQWSNSYMDTIAAQIAAYFGLTSSVQTGSRGTKFDVIDHTITETAGKFLERIAFQSALLATNDRYGNLIFYDAKALSKIATVGTIQEGVNFAMAGQEYEINASGRDRWGKYIAVGESGDADDVQSTAIDSAIPQNRLNIFTADDTPIGFAKSIAAWRRSKQLTKALSISIPLSTWFTPSNVVWRPGMMVTVISDTLELPRGFTFMVRETEHTFDSQGQQCTIKVVPYQAYTGEDIPQGIFG